MSDDVRHECAVALLRLRNNCAGPFAETPDRGGALLSLLLEKQHNRGQDGAGAATLTLSPEPGAPAWNLIRRAGDNPLASLLGAISRRRPLGESVFLGHLRYATYGRGDETFCHPFAHISPRLGQTLFLAGNFNLSNAGGLFKSFVEAGNHPASSADGYLLCELIAAGLREGCGGGPAILRALGDVVGRLDGAYTLCGMTGDGWAFAVRDPMGIRPGFYMDAGHAVAVASERPAIQAAFDVPPEAVRELPPGAALTVSPQGELRLEQLVPPAAQKGCVFERIYFSRANDADIHRERRALGAALARPILDAVGGDLENTFFSYIPNSAQVAFHGLLEALWNEGLAEGRPVRFGQIAVKDAKFRTFIADAAARREFYRHIYDVTYGLVRPGVDTLVVLDDSIVRGNTMRNAILPMLDRLGPRRIVVVSSAPPIRYPDCYGIDMSTLGELVAFRALENLLGAEARKALVAAAEEARAAARRPGGGGMDPLAPLYGRFSEAEHCAEIAKLLTPPEMRAEVSVVFQTVEAMRAACPVSAGDWYFTGDYPTGGGYRALAKALENYIGRIEGRSY